MAKAPLLFLIDIVEALADIKDTRLHLLSLWTKFTEVFIRERTLEVVGILLTFLLRAQHQADFLNTTLHQLF